MPLLPWVALVYVYGLMVLFILHLIVFAPLYLTVWGLIHLLPTSAQSWIFGTVRGK